MTKLMPASEPLVASESEPSSGVERLIMRQPDDWHVHLRDGPMLAAVVGYTARQFARTIVMPNLDPPITTVAAAEAYRVRGSAGCRSEPHPSGSFGIEINSLGAELSGSRFNACAHIDVC